MQRKRFIKNLEHSATQHPEPLLGSIVTDGFLLLLFCLLFKNVCITYYFFEKKNDNGLFLA